MPFLKPKTMKAVFLLFLVLCGSHSYAWGPIAHYLITQKRIQGHNAMPTSASYGGQISTDTLQYVNLPDAWPSNTEPDYGLTVGITPYFCWSHGVRSTGVVDLAWNSVEIPKKPLYHSRWPSKTMARAQGYSPCSMARERVSSRRDARKVWSMAGLE